MATAKVEAREKGGCERADHPTLIRPFHADRPSTGPQRSFDCPVLMSEMKPIQAFQRKSGDWILSQRSLKGPMHRRTASAGLWVAAARGFVSPTTAL
jgi:hypothetical protein